MTNSNSKVNKHFSINTWIISRLKKENSVALTVMAEDYAKERNISKHSARRILERHLKSLIQEDIVERLHTYPITYKLKRLPIQFILPSNKNFRLNDGFDLRHTTHICDSLGNSANHKQKLQELRKVGIRDIRKANRYRQRALLTAQKTSISPQTRQHSDITFLFEENVKEWNRSVIVFANENGEFIESRVKTRFNDKKKALTNLIKSKIALKVAFKRHRNAIMITLTIPHIFPLVLPLREGDKVIGFIPLQDSIISQLKASMLKWIRTQWKGFKIETFTAYEYHTDYALHLHVLVFGIPYLIDWGRKSGRKKEDALTYYSRKYNIPLPDVKKTLITKYVFTALLDIWLQKILVRFDAVLKTNLLQTYLLYKEKEKLQGPVNEIHRIKNGKWRGRPPKDSVIEYSSGAAYKKVLPPDRYVTKYVLKVFEMVSNGGGNIDEENQAKVYGYWLFGKRFNSFSPSLLPRKCEEQRKISHWYYVGVFNKLNLPDFIAKNIILELP